MARSSESERSAVSESAAIDPLEFRKTLGCFTTGVTVITTRSGEGEPIGVTANSFNSVSLDPPLVLWSLARKSRSLEAFEAATHWAVHILSESQEGLSNRFARSGEDKFSGIEVEQGVADTPLFPGCTARLQCRTMFKYEGGDHVIFVGEVVDFERSEEPPLVYHAGKYALATQRSPRLTLVPGEGTGTGSGFDEDFLAYLLGRATLDFDVLIKQRMRQFEVSDVERYILFALAVKAGRTLPELFELLLPVGHGVSEDVCEAMVGRGLLRAETTQGQVLYRLTEYGSGVALELINALKALESELLDRLGRGNAVSLKNLLKLLIIEMDSGVAHPWAGGGLGQHI